MAASTHATDCLRWIDCFLKAESKIDQSKAFHATVRCQASHYLHQWLARLRHSVSRHFFSERVEVVAVLFFG